MLQGRVLLPERVETVFLYFSVVEVSSDVGMGEMADAFNDLLL